MSVSTGFRIAAAAREMVGTRFRPQGCSSAGVDCVGLVLVSLARAGCALSVEQSYPMRFHQQDEAEARLRALGFRGIGPADKGPGDIILFGPTLRQLHFGIVTTSGVVEAHAGLRRVVERPWRTDDRVLSVWRWA